MSEQKMNDLKGFLLLLPDPGNTPQRQKIVSKIRKTYDDVRLNEFTPTDETRTSKYPNYNEYLIKVDVNFGSVLNNQVRKNDVIKRFCHENILSGIGECWLGLNVFRIESMIYKNSVILKSFAFGTVLHMNTFVEHFSSSWSASDSVCSITKPEIKFKHNTCKLQIKFNVANQKAKTKTQNSRQLHKLQLDYNLIMRILIEVEKQPAAKTGNTISYLCLYLHLSGAPFLKIECEADKMDDEDIPARNTLKNGPCSSAYKRRSKRHYRRVVEFGKEDTSAFCSSKVIGKSKVLRLKLQGNTSNSDDIWETVTQLICCCPEAEVYFTSMKQHELKQELSNPSMQNNFDCLYALQTVLSFSFSVCDEINLKDSLKDVNQKLKEYVAKNPMALERSLFQIQEKLQKGDVFRFSQAMESLFEQFHQYFQRTDSSKSLPENVVLLRRALITPTHTVFLPPIVHMKSYLLRNVDPQFAIRVTIRDDNLNQLTFTVVGSKKNKTEFLKRTIGGRLLKGIKVGKRQYNFFGLSSSQLKEHGCLFYAQDTENRTAESIRASLGDLHLIRNVAKYMARMGQCLSQAIHHIDLPAEYVEGPVEDIKTVNSGNEYIFSDGIGQMSLEVAEMCYEAMGLGEGDYKHSAIQIRYAGCKGMLLLNPKLSGRKVVLRKSMWKYYSQNNSLEILKGSYPQRAYLNQPFITILEQMQVDKQVFFELQSHHLCHIFNSLYNSEYAVELLHQESILRLPFQSLHKCGIDLAFEPFFRPMIMAIYTKSIGELKNRSRIKLPFSAARTMFGVLDETGTLEYGQVFVQYTLNYVDGIPSKDTSVLEGTVLITKNPCIHPGDVRKFTAVYVEELMHVKDCVVFPQKGPRPHPDEMAGSDLDGDEYCIVWHEPLFFKDENHKAMDYSNHIKATEKENITVEDMVSFMCDYIRDDCVGLIARAHLAWADEITIFSDLCMRLAKKYATALDFGKTGKSEQLNFDERVKRYPDFMEKFREKETYLSTKALGHLFRNCKKIELVANILSTEVPVEINSSFVCAGWQKYEQDADASLYKFINLFLTPTHLFDLKNEGEIMSGAIKKLEKTFKGKNIEKNISKMLETVIPHVMKKMKEEFYRPFLRHPSARSVIAGSRNEAEALKMLQRYVADNLKMASFKFLIKETPLLVEMLQKASAWYNVAYRRKQEGSSLYLGLPWTVSELLGILHARNNLLKVRNQPSLEVKIGAFLDDQETDLNKFLQGDPSEDCVELSRQIMGKLTEHMARYINVHGHALRELKRFMLSEISDVLKSDDVLSATTPQLLYKYLMSFSNYIHVQFENDEVFWMKKQLGILAIVLLSMLSSTGRLWNTDLENSDESPQFLNLAFLNKEYREEIIFPLDQGKRRYDKEGRKMRSEFGEIMQRYTSEIASMMQRYCKLSHPPNIDFKSAGRDDWNVIVSAYGRPFNIETLKDLIVQPNFHQIVKKVVNDDCCVM